ncbi:MAG: FAD-dependent oxidoreductase [Chloroflexi bacterium]|nr:FAD-dependent oxidoreductase [Chloroflexota bacterium]
MKAGDLDVALDLYTRAKAVAPQTPTIRENLRRVNQRMRAGNNKPDGGRLTLCMIAKNEEERLGRCLESVQGLVDEIVVVDTGSDDRTVEIAESFGARIGSFPWNNNWSDARNESLKLATGDWIIWLDPDDLLPKEMHGKIREAMRQGLGKKRAYFWVLDDQGYEPVTCLQLRLFPNIEGVRFSQPIHEQLTPSLIALGITCEPTDIRVVHTGYTTPEVVRDKQERYLAIMEEWLETHPDDYVIRSHAAQTHYIHGNLDQAIRYYEQIIEDHACHEDHNLIIETTARLFLGRCYIRQEKQGLVVGPYEMEGVQAWALDGVDWGFDMELLPPDIDRLTPHLELVMKRLPAFADAGIKQIVSGMITHTPDGNFLLGPAAGLRNFWMCCAASIGITQGPGAGRTLAQWMVHGQSELNVREMDARRFGDWAIGDYAVEKSIDEYKHMYFIRFPGEFRDAGRPVKTTPIYQKLKDQGAVYAEASGWERPKWFSKNGEEERYSYRRTNWFEPVAEECRAVRERVGVLDLSSFSKYDVTGAGAESFLNRLFANRMPRRVGGITLAHMLTEDGMIESEATITRLAEDRFYLLSGAVAELHDLDMLVHGKRDDEDVAIANVTGDYGVLVLSGPRARDVMRKLTDADLGNNAFPWLTGQEIEVAGVPTRALRISYVGELGWELHHPMAEMAGLYDAIMAAGEGFGIANFGLYAMNCLRVEKGYRGWGAELTNEITMTEADMERFLKLDKDDFIGREAALKSKADGPRLGLVYLVVDADDSDCAGNEPVIAEDRVIGVTTSGGYGHAVAKSIAFAYVEPAYTTPGTSFEVRLLGRSYKATVMAEPLYDPLNERMRV